MNSDDAGNEGSDEDKGKGKGKGKGEGRKKRAKKPRFSLLEMLPPEAYQRLLTYVGVGCFWHVAAQAIGISEQTFMRWMRIGKKHERQGRQSIYTQLRHDVLQRHFSARATAEAKVWDTDPKWWLTHGPAKEDWSERSTIILEGDAQVKHEHLVISSKDLIESTKQALGILSELGLLSLTEDGKRAFLKEKPVEVTPVQDQSDGG